MNNEINPDDVQALDAVLPAGEPADAAGEVTQPREPPVITDDSYVGKALKEVAALENAAVVQGPKMVEYAWPPTVASTEAASCADALKALVAAFKVDAAAIVGKTRDELIARHESGSNWIDLGN